MSQPAKKRTALLVVGMHRSGTSALTRLVNLMGCELGTELLAARANDNETGFWEHQDLNLLHEEMLVAMAKWWADFRPWPANWATTPVAESFAARIADVVQRDFANVSLFAIKDPRLCRLLPIWQQAAAACDIDLRVAFILRHPSEVVQSLSRRDGLSASHGALLWWRYLIEGERCSRQLPRTALTYDHLLQDWQQAIGQLGQRLKIEWPVQIDAVSPEVEDFLNPALRHNKRIDLNTLGVAESARLQQLYSLFENADGPDGFPLPAAMDRHAADIEPAMAMIEPWLREQDHDLAVLRQLLSSEPAHSQAVHAEVRRLRQDIESLTARLRETE